MADLSPQCPKCEQLMERGYRPDAGHGYVLLAAWAPGAPEVRRFFGGIKVRGEALVPMQAYRCPSCGFVECYAQPALERRS